MCLFLVVMNMFPITSCFFFFNDTATTEIYTLSLHDALPILLDVTKDPGYMYPDLARKEGLCSLLSVPMLVKDKPIGVINSYTSHEHLFSAEEIKEIGRAHV